MWEITRALINGIQVKFKSAESQRLTGHQAKPGAFILMILSAQDVLPKRFPAG
jgi:hypothetical protein